MNTFIADAALQRSLDALESLTEIRDAHGKIIGYFSPAVEGKSAAVYSRAAAQFDAEEMKRRKESGDKGLTTGEVLKRLKSLEK